MKSRLIWSALVAGGSEGGTDMCISPRIRLLAFDVFGGFDIGRGIRVRAERSSMPNVRITIGLGR